MEGDVVRVELPGGESSDLYKKLDREMGQEYFSSWFSDQGEAFELPHGTYQNHPPGPYRNLEQAHLAARWQCRSWS
jgi:hypothetical protein